jgi:quercetin dioxygenase-like cupin family protein
MAAAHSHDGFDETNYGLVGVTTFTVDGERRELHAGEVVFILRGAVHAFENRSIGNARFLAVDARPPRTKLLREDRGGPERRRGRPRPTPPQSAP